jgi:hypothetical protein
MMKSEEGYLCDDRKTGELYILEILVTSQFGIAP